MSEAARRIRPLLLLALLLLPALPPTAPAQGVAPVMCLDRDAENSLCSGRSVPNYMQGDTIVVSVRNAGLVTIAARCVAGCPSPDASATTTYYAITSGNDVKFPGDFIEAPGGNAVADRAPRYNSTWEFTTDVAGQPLARRANVWLIDAYLDTNLTIRPGEEHHIRVAGVDPGAQLSLRLERKDSKGTWELLSAPPARALAQGTFDYRFRLPLEEAERILACGIAIDTCYRLVVDAPGKVREIVPIRVGIADITRGPTIERPGLQLGQRSQNLTVDVDLYYPGGNAFLGPKFRPEMLPVSPAFGDRSLRVAVERVNATGAVQLLEEVPLRFVEERFSWRAQWTVPRDLEIDRSAIYRFRLAEARDLWGNRVREDLLGNFTIDVASLRPVVVSSFPELPRTDLGTVSVRVSYLNGTPFTPDQAAIEGNASPLVGCFARMARPPPDPAPDPRSGESGTCLARELTYGTYDAAAGAWNFTVRYPREYANLDAHRFILQNGTEDRWGNRILQVVGDPFSVVVAKPRVNLTTVMRGVDTETFERGARVTFTATITYGDGSPFNHSVRPNPDAIESQILQGVLTRRGPAPEGGYGPVASVEAFNLTETDPFSGRWSGTLQLTDDDTFTPVGLWSFAFDVFDNVTVPNVNRTVFDREIVSSLVQLCPTFQPSGSAPTGAILKFRYTLYYSECDKPGREVPPGVVGDRITAQLYRFNPQNQSVFGAPVSGVLQPLFARDAGADFGIEYQIPDNLYSGTYVFVVRGSDIYGNKLTSLARSRPFTTFTEPVERTVLTQPAVEVRRGESAVVVFDALEGDTGLDPARAPRIQLERFDPASTACADAAEVGGCWLRERSDVRVNDSALTDHMGVFPIEVSTAVGLYRFTLQARDSTFHVLVGVSENFTVAPTNVTRAFVVPPPERVVKGAVFSFALEHFGGDEIKDRIVLLNGRPLAIQGPQQSYQGPIVNLTWAVPYDAPNGNYSVVLRGRDVNGNTIVVVSPPIDATAASLSGVVIGQPARTVERGEPARVLFGITYPDGKYYSGAETPRVVVRDAAGASVDDAKVVREGLTFAATWTPAMRTPLGEYTFEVVGASGSIGNAFPSLRSQPLRVLPGEVTRAAIDTIPPQVERMTSATLGIPADPTDRFVGFEMVYYGPSLSLGPFDRDLVEVTRTPVLHTLEASGSKYAVHVNTDEATQTGTYRVVMQGEDRDGNRIVARSGAFVITPTTILVSFNGFPPPAAFGEGKTIELTFTGKYRAGPEMDETFGRPSVAVTYNSRVITQRPELTFEDGFWRMTWTAPEDLPDGEYYFAVGGADANGNTIATTRSIPYVVSTELGESFLKVIPGPSPVLVALVAAALAIALLRRRA